MTQRSCVPMSEVSNLISLLFLYPPHCVFSLSSILNFVFLQRPHLLDGLVASVLYSDEATDFGDCSRSQFTSKDYRSLNLGRVILPLGSLITHISASQHVQFLHSDTGHLAEKSDRQYYFVAAVTTYCTPPGDPTKQGLPTYSPPLVHQHKASLSTIQPPAQFASLDVEHLYIKIRLDFFTHVIRKLDRISQR
ncbi:hypothetical protein F0562_001250 [Nyssa sinensis]|uniref:Uncharacterized protein n=1 Tax=Nyssa sinensis TaxID=561372 RepID=A0A5J5C6Y0_9ASTE|nr:hypothetical protein F0562_001250 [Nyssa sinensis]